MDINGNSPFLKVLQGLFQIDFPSTCSLKIKKHLSHGLQFCNLWKFVFISTQDSLFIFQSIFPVQIILQGFSGFSLSDKRGVFYVHLKVLWGMQRLHTCSWHINIKPEVQLRPAGNWSLFYDVLCLATNNITLRTCGKYARWKVLGIDIVIKFHDLIDRDRVNYIGITMAVKLRCLQCWNRSTDLERLI